MSSFSNISIVGNLTRDPEMKVFESSGRKKTTMTVAVNNWSKNKNNQIEKNADFYKVETWDRLADLTKDYLKKGSQVAVSGRLHLENWKDNNGKDRVTPIVKANQIALPQRGTAKSPEVAANSKTELKDEEIRAEIIKEDDEYDVKELPPELSASDGGSSQSYSSSLDDGDAEVSEDGGFGDGDSQTSNEVPQLTQFGQTMKLVDPNAIATTIQNPPTTPSPPTSESVARSA